MARLIQDIIVHHQPAANGRRQGVLRLITKLRHDLKIHKAADLQSQKTPDHKAIGNDAELIDIVSRFRTRR